jgi:hypothetical protein
MRDLNRDVGRRRKDLVQEGLRVCPAIRRSSPQVNNNRHPPLIRRAKYLA